jgi:DNA polymerase-3 subunit gamma/tau
MGETLYRKYRPQRFADIHGQSSITTTLTNQISSGRTAHAYVFAGTRGTGKTTSARVFAKAMNCHSRVAGTFEPCEICPSCTDISAGRSVDVIELDAATHTGVETVREEIIENARFLPTRDKFKIFIIDEVHMLSTSSFNALLKSLEEPPAHVMYILATTELHKIPATVASRCQRFIFHPLPLAVMETKLRSIAAAENMNVDDSVIRRILATSGGAMRDAESLLGQLLALGAAHITDAEADIVLPPTLFTETMSVIDLLSKNSGAETFALIETLFERGIDMVWLHDALIRRAHELLVAGTAGTVPLYLGIYSDTEAAALVSKGRSIDASWLARFLEALIEKKPLYKTIASPFIPLHLVIGSMCAERVAAPPKPVQAAPVAPKPAPAAPIPAPAPAPAPVVAPTPAPVTVAPKPQPVAPPPMSSDSDFDMPMISLREEGDVSEIPMPEIEHMPEPAHPLEPELTGGMTRDELTRHWTTTINFITNEHPSLGIVFGATSIYEIKDNLIALAVKFPMYREKLMDIKVKTRIENKMSELCGRTMLYSVTHISEQESLGAEVTDILDTFGGRVVG